MLDGFWIKVAHVPLSSALLCCQAASISMLRINGQNPPLLRPATSQSETDIVRKPEGCSWYVFRQAHPLMQNADDRNDLAGSSVDDDVRADEIKPMRFRQLVGLVADVGMLADEIKGFFEFVSIDDELILAPRFAGVPQNVDEILLRNR
jgi:hypothetical protein